MHNTHNMVALFVSIFQVTNPSRLATSVNSFNKRAVREFTYHYGADFKDN